MFEENPPMNKCSFLIVCLSLFAACTAPRQVVSGPPVAIEAPPVEIVFESEILLPEWTNVEFVEIPCDTFSLFLDFEKTQVKIEPADGGKHKVTSTRKEETIPVSITDSVTVLTVRYPGLDSVWVIHAEDTTFSHVILNDFEACPAVMPAVPTGEKFPVAYVLGFILAMALWWIGKQRKAKG